MFLNREEAGILLASKMGKIKGLRNPIVVAIPRGGIIVGNIVSRILQIPIFPLVVKKITAPDNPELALGAVGTDGIVYWDENIIEKTKVSQEEKKMLLKRTTEAVRTREEKLGAAKINVIGRDVIIVDDGVATGSTAVAASIILKKLHAQKIILAMPVISKRTKKEISKYFNQIVSVITPRDFSAVGQFYKEFSQIEDEEVKDILKANIK